MAEDEVFAAEGNINIFLGGAVMPRGDGTGPEGKGSQTGRGAGKCTGNEVPGAESPEAPRGFFKRFFGRGTGRGAGKKLGRGGAGRGRGGQSQ